MTLSSIWNSESPTKPCLVKRTGSTYLLLGKLGDDLYDAVLLSTAPNGYGSEGRVFLRSTDDDWEVV